MKVGEKVTAKGYMKVHEDDAEKWPFWLDEGEHVITAAKNDPSWGEIVKTNKHDFWMSERWFKRG